MHKLRAIPAIILLCLFGLSLIAAISAPPLTTTVPESGDKIRVLSVQAWIDGRDLLHISPNGLYWHHLDYAAVGRLEGANQPTKILMRSYAGLSRRAPWHPEWNCPDWECRDYQTDSSTFRFGLPLPSKYQLISVGILQERQSITVYQYPSAANGYETIIDFNDDGWGGADWYAIQLVVNPVK